ncbi:ubiquinone anaerobic biosynthesis accessory factor UbiT [Pararhodobacter oceanensis]|uniref:ubiquinone anaerobic biosynthesis accessory factor UbiT n=1 Tax=Pararhodobacter oceanensis TaxID=2172121 RepID=UPI001F0BBF9E|nr:SCP2 sterol-binding domain-containing protein [Pararhodobacter oceanensis]
MSQPSTPIPTCPRALAQLLRVLPLAPLSLSLTAYSRRIAKHHPGLFRRLGVYGDRRFILDPTDLPIVLCLDPKGGRPRVQVLRQTTPHDARISGPLAALLGLVHGAYDGDALFFSRDLVIAGDTGAALALRNAVDDAELNLAQEIAAISGPFARPLRKIIARIEQHSGVFLTRPDDAPAW